MIETKQPHILISELLVKYKYKNKRGFFIVDDCYVHFEVDEETYYKCDVEEML